MNQYVVSYLVVTLDYILDLLRKDQCSLPDGLDSLPSKLKGVMAKNNHIRCDPQFRSIVERYLGLFEEQILNTLTAFSAMRISKEDLQRLDRSSHILQTLNKISASWGLEVCADPFLQCLYSLAQTLWIFHGYSFYFTCLHFISSRLNLTAAHRALNFVILASCWLSSRLLRIRMTPSLVSVYLRRCQPTCSASPSYVFACASDY
jgi:hypothetical protein